MKLYSVEVRLGPTIDSFDSPETNCCLICEALTIDYFQPVHQWSHLVRTMCPPWLLLPPPATPPTLPARLGTESAAPAGRIAAAEPGMTATDQVNLRHVVTSLVNQLQCRG